MSAARALFVAVLLAAPVAQAQVQTWPTRPGATVDAHRWQADQHRYEMDRLRARADERETVAWQQRLEARLTRLEIEARRAPEPWIPREPQILRSPEQERSVREAASERRRRTASEVGQIDAWLDRAAQ